MRDSVTLTTSMLDDIRISSDLEADAPPPSVRAIVSPLPVRSAAARVRRVPVRRLRRRLGLVPALQRPRRAQPLDGCHRTRQMRESTGTPGWTAERC